MLKKVFLLYKTPLLISIVLSIVLVALKAQSHYLQLSLILLGSLAGTFFLDLDYIIYAYFLDPGSSFSQTLKGFLRHKDLYHAGSYIYYNEDQIKEKTLNSALFQIVLTALMVFVVGSGANFLLKALVLSVFISSIYRMQLNYIKGKSEEWFWALKSKPNKNAFVLYTTVLLGIFVYCLSIF